MTIQDLGSIGEFIAAIATVATLAYLAVQIRQNTAAVRRAANRGVVDDANSWRYRLIENAEVSEIFRTGLANPESLDANSKYRFRMLLDALFAHWAHAFDSGEEEFIANANISRILSQPGGEWYWSRAKATDDLFPAGFVEFIGSLEPKSTTGSPNVSSE